ncbi:hypothetical protein LCGC14_2472170, partial [marine sediment metagenome]
HALAVHKSIGDNDKIVKAGMIQRAKDLKDANRDSAEETAEGFYNLARGTAGQVLTMGSPLIPSWAANAASGSPVPSHTHTEDQITDLKAYLLTAGDGLQTGAGSPVVVEVDNTVVRLSVGSPVVPAINLGELRMGMDIQIQDGKSLQIFDSSGNDQVFMNHDGTDFNITATNTTDINITGADLTMVAADINIAEDQSINFDNAPIRGESQSLVDDATGTFTVTNWAIFIVNCAFDEKSMGMFSKAGTNAILKVAVPANERFSVGATNPDVDGDINIWPSSGSEISIKNRLGSTRTFNVWFFGA